MPSNVLDRIVGAVAAIAAVLIFSMMALTIIDLVARQFFGGGIPAAVDLIEVTLPALVYLGLASAERAGAHVSTPLVTSRLPFRVAETCKFISLTIIVVFLAWYAFSTFQAGIVSFQKGEYRVGIAQVPIWPTKLIIPIGLALLTVCVAARAWTALMGVLGRRKAPTQEELEQAFLPAEVIEMKAEIDAQAAAESAAWVGRTTP